MNQVGSLTIAKLASASGVKRETIRFYEQRGLLPAPARSASGYRMYSAEEARRVRFIRLAQSLGFTLEEIGSLLALRSASDSTCGMVKARATEKIADIDRKISTLTKMKSALVKIAASCDGGSLPLNDCPILSSLDANDKVP